MRNNLIEPIKQEVYKYYDWILCNQPTPSEIENKFKDLKCSLDFKVMQKGYRNLEDLFSDMYFRTFTSDLRMEGVINFELFENDTIRRRKEIIWGRELESEVTIVKNNLIEKIESYGKRSITWAVSWYYNDKIVQNKDYYSELAEREWKNIGDISDITRTENETEFYKVMLNLEYNGLSKEEFIEKFKKNIMRSAELHEMYHNSKGYNPESFDDTVKEEKKAILTEMRYGDDQYYGLGRLLAVSNKPTIKAAHNIFRYFIDAIHDDPEQFSQIDQSKIKIMEDDYREIMSQMHKLTRENIKYIAEKMYRGLE